MSRLKSSRGMTFMELLCAVLILMMSTALVLVGVNLALTTYRANMEASEAQVLYSTLTTVISDKLRYCGTVETAEDGTVRLSQRTRCKSLVEVSGRTGSHSARWRAQAKIAGRSDSI